MGALGAHPCSCANILASGTRGTGMPKPFFTQAPANRGSQVSCTTPEGSQRQPLWQVYRHFAGELHACGKWRCFNRDAEPDTTLPPQPDCSQQPPLGLGMQPRGLGC